MSKFEPTEWRKIKRKVMSLTSDVGLMDYFGSIQDASTVYVRQYKFQEEIIRKGVLTSTDKHLVDLQYAKTPLGIILNNAVEIHYGDEETFSPIRILRQGDLIGLFETLDFLDKHEGEQLRHRSNYYNYSATAGANSIFPSKFFADSEKLRSQLNARSNSKITTVRDLIHAAEPRFDWTVEILFFSRTCIEGKEPRKHLPMLGWCSTHVLRHMAELESSGLFALGNPGESKKGSKNQRRDSFVAGVVRDLYLIGLNELPCFIPVSNSKDTIQTELGPFDKLYDILKNGGDPRLELLVPGYLRDADAGFGCYPASVCRHKKVLTQGLLEKSCNAVKRTVGQLGHVFEECGIEKDQLKLIPAGGKSPYDKDLSSLPFEIAPKSTTESRQEQAAPKPLYVNSRGPIAGSIIITKKHA